MIKIENLSIEDFSRIEEELFNKNNIIKIFGLYFHCKDIKTNVDEYGNYTMYFGDLVRVSKRGNMQIM